VFYAAAARLTPKTRTPSYVQSLSRATLGWSLSAVGLFALAGRSSVNNDGERSNSFSIGARKAATFGGSRSASNEYPLASASDLEP